MKGYLNDCCKIELLTSRIYQHFSAQSAFPDLLRSTFADLAQDEEDHARQFDLALELPEGAVGTIHRVAWARVSAGLDLVRAKFQDLHLTSYPAEEALKTALRLEKAFIRMHFDNIVYIEDSRVSALFGSLARADEEHLATLRETVIWWNRQKEMNSISPSVS